MHSIRAGEVAAGALAGTISGLVLEIAMTQVGLLSSIALVIRTDSPFAGIAVYLIVAAVFGVGFEILVARHRLGAGETVLWGLAYGALWWLASALTVLPILRGGGPEWSVAAAQAEFPSLICHLLFGACTGLVLAVMLRSPLTPRRSRRAVAGNLARGVIAGLAAVGLLDGSLGPFDLGLAVITGAGFAVLYPRSHNGSGPTLIRGTGYGFLLWLLLALTLVPVLQGSGPAWSVEQARAAFATFPPYLLAGAVTALLHRWMDNVWRVLFSDPGTLDDEDEEAVGARGLHATARGAVAGLLGGLPFAAVMVQLGFLDTVAGLVGATSPVTGLVVHLHISVAIGVLYGLAFRRQSYDAASALGWGVAYGFFWWVLGALTLLPMWLGGPPQWSAGAVAEAFPQLIGHVAYGATLGTAFLALEGRSGPRRLSRTQVEARRAARHRAALQGAPAVWALMIVIAITIPIMLAAPPT